MYYPKSVYSINETVTRDRMQAYDKKQALFNAECEKENSQYWHLGLKARLAIRDAVAARLGWQP